MVVCDEKLMEAMNMGRFNNMRFARNYHSFYHKSNIAYNGLMKSSECIKSLHEEEAYIFTSSYYIGRKKVIEGKRITLPPP
jgi:hypothetical protein